MCGSILWFVVCFEPLLYCKIHLTEMYTLCAETYQDVIDNVKTNSKKLFKKYQEYVKNLFIFIYLFLLVTEYWISSFQN